MPVSQAAVQMQLFVFLFLISCFQLALFLFVHTFHISYSVLKMFNRQGELILLFISPLIQDSFGLRGHTKPAFVRIYYQDVTCRSKSIIENVVDKSMILDICR